MLALARTGTMAAAARRLRIDPTTEAARVNDGGALLDAIRAGLGRGVLPRAVGDAEPGLQHLDEPEAVFERELWLLTHPELRRLARVRVVAGWLDATVAGG